MVTVVSGQPVVTVVSPCSQLSEFTVNNSQPVFTVVSGLPVFTVN